MFTTPPGKHVVIYDGHCKFCIANMKLLQRAARKNALTPLSFQDTGVLDQFPGLTHEMCMDAMYLITPEGRMYRGAEAAAQAIATRPILGKVAYLYYLPGLRWISDRIYALIAKHRYK